MLKEFGLVPSLISRARRSLCHREGQPYWGGQAVWKDILATLPKVVPSRGTPFQSDAESIIVAVQTKYLAGGIPTPRRRSTTPPTRSRARPACRSREVRDAGLGTRSGAGRRRSPGHSNCGDGLGSPMHEVQGRCATQSHGLRLPRALSADLRRLLGLADHQLVPDLVPGHAHHAVAVQPRRSTGAG